MTRWKIGSLSSSTKLSSPTNLRRPSTGHAKKLMASDPTSGMSVKSRNPLVLGARNPRAARPSPRCTPPPGSATGAAGRAGTETVTSRSPRLLLYRAQEVRHALLAVHRLHAVLHEQLVDLLVVLRGRGRHAVRDRGLQAVLRPGELRAEPRLLLGGARRERPALLGEVLEGL